MIYWQLFYEFFRIGLFAIGGGMATVPFLYELADRYPWFTVAQLGDMIAISEATPGPTGINMATCAGYRAAGVAGGMVAVFALVLPAYLCIVIITRCFLQFYKNRRVRSAFACLRPVVTAQIAAALLSILQTALFTAAPSGAARLSLPAVCLFAALLCGVRRFRLHPLVYLAAGGVAGLFLHL